MPNPYPWILKLSDVTKAYSRNAVPAVSSVSIHLKSGKILGLLGPSGCGKTTLLRLIAGFEKPSQGKIYINEALVASPNFYSPPERRGIGMVFQDFALFPHLTVAENICFGLKPLQHLSSKQKAARVREFLDLVRLTDLDHRYPHELSGGQQQRVALARALAPRPNLVLLDEPLSNLDVQVRLKLREELRVILKECGTTAIFVTHDQEEAMAMADEIAVMHFGEIEQMGTPESIYLNPKTPFVAEFVSQANFISATLDHSEWRTEIGSFPTDMCHCTQASSEPQISECISDESNTLDRVTQREFPTPETVHAENDIVLMIREEDLLLQPSPNGKIVISDRQFLGREYRYCLKTPSGKELHARSPKKQPWSIGTTVSISITKDHLNLFHCARYAESMPLDCRLGK